MTAKTTSPMSMVRFLPITSERAPAGSLKKIPVTVDTPTAKPMASGPAPRYRAKRGSTGLLASAYESLAKNPTVQRALKGDSMLITFNTSVFCRGLPVVVDALSVDAEGYAHDDFRFDEAERPGSPCSRSHELCNHLR